MNKQNILLIVKSVFVALVYNLIVSLITFPILLVADNSGLFMIIKVIIVIILSIINVFLCFVLYPRLISENYNKKLVVVLSIIMFLYSTVIAVVF